MIKTIFGSLFISLFFVLTGIGFYPPVFLYWLVSWPFDRERDHFHFVTAAWARLYLKACPFWKYTIKGTENISGHKNFVIVSNHQSMMDVAVLFQLPLRYKWVAKIELFRIPVFGWVMRHNGYISLKRGNRRSVAHMHRRIKKELNAKNSVLMFPEGTRARDGEMKPFKEGAFKMAVDTNTPILPVIIDGSYKSLPKKGIWFTQNVTIQVQVLAPRLPEHFNNDASLLCQTVQDVMQTHLRLTREDKGYPREA